MAMVVQEQERKRKQVKRKSPILGMHRKSYISNLYYRVHICIVFRLKPTRYPTDMHRQLLKNLKQLICRNRKEPEHCRITIFKKKEKWLNVFKSTKLFIFLSPRLLLSSLYFYICFESNWICRPYWTLRVIPGPEYWRPRAVLWRNRRRKQRQGTRQAIGL